MISRSWQLLMPRPFIEEPIDIHDYEIRRKATTPWTSYFLLVLSMLGFATAFFEAVEYQSRTAIVSSALWVVILTLICTFRPRTGSVILVLLYAGTVACHAISIAQSDSWSWTIIIAFNMVAILLALVAGVVVLNMPLRDPALPTTDISPPFATPSKNQRSPEDNLTLWQWMSVSWMLPLIRMGSKRQLNDDDVWFLAYEFQHTHLHEAFRLVTGTVVRRLIKANWVDFVILTVLAVFELSAMLSAPLLLQKLLQAMEYLDTTRRPAIVYTCAILVIRLAYAQSGVFSLWFGRRCYERSRGEMITMLHEKVLHRKIIGAQPKEKAGNEVGELNGSAQNTNGENGHVEAGESEGLLSGKPTAKRGIRELFTRASKWLTFFLPSRFKQSLPDNKEPASMGKVLNLMRNDVYETAQRFWEIQDLLKKPLGLIFSIILTWHLIGWSCLIGIGLVVVAQIGNAFLARLIISWEKVRRRATDHKLQQITQYIEAIRHLRWYGWHSTMLEDVMSARQKELYLKMVNLVIGLVVRFVNFVTTYTFPVVVFWAYTTLAGRQLRIDIVFPALQLFKLLQANLKDLPNQITVLINAFVAVGRIEDFMSEPELTENESPTYDNRFELVNATFSWPGSQSIVLQDLTLSFPRGLTTIVGPVASGKTALLQAMLGELDQREGDLIRPDTAIAYCSQTPWLQSMSIRENILFGSNYQEVRYKTVLEACALLPDFASFKQGDLSPIGENGIGLSGGQKARVALARALYSTAEYILLDDPLSALDQQTAEHIVNKCFRSDLLKERTTILVTHRTDLCHGLSIQTVAMSEGTAKAYGQEVLSSNGSLVLNKIESHTEQIRKDQESAAVPENFEDEEHRAHGDIRLQVYWEYVKAGKLKWWFCVLLIFALWRVIDYGQTWFLKALGEAYKTSKQTVLLLVQEHTELFHASSTPIDRFLDRLPDPGMNIRPWLRGLLYFAVAQSVFLSFGDIFELVMIYNSGKNMFRDAMVSISNATFRFYDVTPVGRLMNRITGDLATIDGAICRRLVDVIWEMIKWAGSVVVIASITPLFLMFSIALAAVFVYIFLQFLPTSQSLRRLEMVSLSPLMSNFGALLHGLMTVRAFHAQSQFQARVIGVTDAFQKMDHFYWSLQAWLMYRFDVLSAISQFLMTLLAIYSGLSAGLTAFVLIAAQNFVNSTHQLCHLYGQLQLDFVAVERVVELLHLEQESPGDLEPPASWPKPAGDIVFENVTIRYASHLPPALKNVSVTIPGGLSTAITGRTGSGKSTLALAMLGTIVPEKGRILIDGIDIARVSKQALRTRVTFLAQEPVLFQGSLRTNLDPLSQHSDTECSSVLERIGGGRFGWTLTTDVDTGGKNLSQGQRQFVGLARALLRRSSIIIMDEATASIDLEGSLEVQKILRQELKGSTVVGIAHRSSAVESASLVVQLAKGEVVGAGPPEELEGSLLDEEEEEEEATR